MLTWLQIELEMRRFWVVLKIKAILFDFGDRRNSQVLQSAVWNDESFRLSVNDSKEETVELEIRG